MPPSNLTHHLHSLLKKLRGGSEDFYSKLYIIESSISLVEEKASALFIEIEQHSGPDKGRMIKACSYLKYAQVFKYACRNGYLLIDMAMMVNFHRFPFMRCVEPNEHKRTRVLHRGALRFNIQFQRSTIGLTYFVAGRSSFFAWRVTFTYAGFASKSGLNKCTDTSLPPGIKSQQW